MGRLPKKGVDYFPHDTDASDKVTLFTLEFKYGNNGYAFWFKLLEFIGRKENLCLDTRDKIDWMYFVAKTKLSEDIAKDILSSLAELGAIDAHLWTKGIVWSDNFVDRLSDVYKKRGTKIPQKPFFRDEKPSEPALAEKEKTQKRVKPGQKSSETTAAEKIQYADFVNMKPKEYDTLCTKLGKPAADKCVEVLNNYKGATGKTYRDDYRAILLWVIKKVTNEYPNLIQKTSTGFEEGGNPFGEYR